MFDKYFNKKIKINEEKKAILREYHLVCFWHYSISFLIILLDFFFLFLLLSYHFWGLMIFIIVLLLGLLIGIRRYVIWSLNAFLVTNKRIIDFDQTSLFNKNVNEVFFAKIQDIGYNKKGFFSTLFNYGNVIIKTANSDGDLALKYVYQPEKIQALLVNIQEEVNDKNNEEKEE